MSARKFDPNRLSFDEGLERIRKAVDEVGLRSQQIVTSRDEGAQELRRGLQVDNVPDGFRKWPLPVYLESASQAFVTIAEPGVSTARHSHEEGDGIRFIAGGSILYEGRELVAGDWMFIPKGQEYEFQVGPYGAIMCYCYCCCCA